MVIRSVRLVAHLCVASLALGAAAAHAKYPEKPVTVIVPYSAGGSVDVIARVLAQKISEQTGKSFVVDNKAGASGNIGAALVARSRPDGYNLLFTSVTTAAITGAMFTKGVGYTLNQDLVPVALTATLPVVLISSPASQIRSLADLLNASKKKPGGVTFGSAGPGSIEHVSGELFMREAKVNMTHIPYKGGADALRDLMGNQIDIVFAPGGGSFTAIEGNKVNGVAIGSAKRAPVAPNLPTLQEAGLVNFDAKVVYGLMAPAGLPAETVKILQTEVNKALQDPETIRKLREQSAEVRFVAGEQASAGVQVEIDKWGKVVREANIKAD